MDRVILQSFIILAQTLNYSRAAQQQFISQPALTKQINKLESELGVQLFHRTTQGVSLTQAGQEFYTFANKILDEFIAAEKRMEEIRRGYAGKLRIATIPGMEFCTTGIVNAFRKKYSDVSLYVDYMTGTQQLMSVNTKSHDIYFSFSALVEASGGLDSIGIHSNRFAVYVCSEYARKHENEESILWLNNYPVVSERKTDGPYLVPRILSLMEERGLNYENMIYCPNVDSAMYLVQCGIGYAVLPDTMNHGTTPIGVTKIPLEGEDAEIANSIGWHRDSDNLMVKKFIEIAADLYK